MCVLDEDQMHHGELMSVVKKAPKSRCCKPMIIGGFGERFLEEKIVGMMKRMSNNRGDIFGVLFEDKSEMI